MKKLLYFILAITTFAAVSCKKSGEPFGFYRPSNPQNFINIHGGELYAYTDNDSLKVRADYYLIMVGQIKKYRDDNIIDYGHCWSKDNPNPVLGADTLRTNNIPADGIDDVQSTEPATDSISFTSSVSRLSALTTYYIRSYIITSDEKGLLDTGYNPYTTVITTKQSIDIWEEITDGNRPAGMRYGALGFNFGDSIIFGTGYDRSDFLSSMMMFDPVSKTWKQLPDVITVNYSISNSGSGKGFIDGIGFGMEFYKTGQPKKSRYLFVGLGDYVGDNLWSSKCRKLMAMDLLATNPAWTVLENNDQTYAGGHSGSVCFVIKDRAYVGTGATGIELNNRSADWYVFRPEDAVDGNPGTFAWEALDNLPTTIGRTGAVAFTIGSRGYFGLGVGSDGLYKKDFYEFKPSTDLSDATKVSWVRLDDFPGEGRKDAVAFVIGDMGYVGSGDNIDDDLFNLPGNYQGQVFDDFYAFDPYNKRWKQVRDYTSDKLERVNISKRITNGVGFAYNAKREGYAGFGINIDSVYPVQHDIWRYLPFDSQDR